MKYHSKTKPTNIDTTPKEIIREKSEKRKEKIYVEYSNGIKATDIHLIDILKKKKSKERYKDILDYSVIDNNSSYSIAIGKSGLSVLSSLLIDDNVNVFELEKDIIDKYVDFYYNTDITMFGESLQKMLADRVAVTKFGANVIDIVDKIYIYHPYEDHRVTVDLEKEFDDDSRVELVFGDNTELLQDTSITTYVFHNIYDINRLIVYNNLRYSEILLPRIYCNFDEENNPLLDITNISVKNICKIGFYNPYNENKKIKNLEDLYKYGTR